MKYQFGVLAFAVGLVLVLTMRHNSKIKQPTEILKVERTQDGSEGEFNIVTKSFCYYGITQRELDSILISLGTDTIQ